MNDSHHPADDPLIHLYNAIDKARSIAREGVRVTHGIDLLLNIEITTTGYVVKTIHHEWDDWAKAYIDLDILADYPFVEDRVQAIANQICRVIDESVAEATGGGWVDVQVGNMA